MSSLETAAYDCLDAAHAFDRFGVTLPEAADTWLRKLQELRAAPPAEAARNKVAELIVDGARPVEVDKALAYAVSQNLRCGQHRLAQQLAGQRMLDALLQDRARVHSELKTTADAIINRLHEAAQLDETIVELTRQRRTAEAHLAAVAESDVAELSDLYAIRNAYLTEPGAKWSTGWFDCSVWANPWAIGHVTENDGTKWGFWRAKIRAGGKLWFVPHEVATAASQEHEPADMVKPIDPRRTGHGTFVT